ncbi:MAG: GNAT family protein [Verrucomicrobiota bacterium]
MRPFEMKDATQISELINDIRVAQNLSRVPHPYPEGEAERWIGRQEEAFREGTDCNFAVTLAETGEVMGSMGVHPNEDQLRAEVGYWLAVRHWGKGYATEALREVIRFSFEDYGLQRVYATHFANNPASGRVMEKVGMKFEGVLRLGISRFGELKDCVMRAIIKPDWERLQDD